MVRVTSPLAHGEMYLHGGHVTSYSPVDGPRIGPDVLFMSRHAYFEDGRAIRGGIPVCFPWFGALAGRSDAPSHGCVRTRAWALDAVEQTAAGVTVTMSTSSDSHTRALWPGDFRIVNRATFGSSLTVALTVVNTGSAPFDFEEALHTYYRVGAIDNVLVRGLDDVRYLDALDDNRERTQADAIGFAAEVDRIYLDTSRPVLIDDRSSARRLRVSTDASHTTVVWNPWVAKAHRLADLGDDEWREFVCVETCNVAPRPVTLAAGAAHTMRMVVAVER